jgi:hypothetical protein
MAQTEVMVYATELESVRKDLPVLFDRPVTFYSTIEKRNVEQVSNYALRIPAEMYPGGKGGHFSPAGGSLGLGTGPTFDKFTTNVVHLKYAIQWEKKAEWATDSNRKAVLQSTRYLISKALVEFRRLWDCLYVGSDGHGNLGTVSAVSNAGGVDTVTMDDGHFGTKLLRYAQDIAYFDSSYATNRTAGVDREITFHDTVNKQIKTSTTFGLTATDIAVVGGLGNVNGTSVVSVNGVPYHHSNASSGTYQGLNRATYPQIRANGINASSGTLALSYVRRALNAIGDRIGEDQMKKPVAWMHPCQKQAYEELGQTVSIIQKQARNEGLDLFYGDNLQMAGVPIKTHYAWDKSRIDFVVGEVWGRSVMHELDWYEVEGRRFFELRDTDGSVMTSTVSYLTASQQSFVTQPPAISYIYGLAVPTGY